MLSFVLGVGVGLAAATSYAVGVLLQSLEAREAPSTVSLRLSLLRWLVKRQRWLIGTLWVFAAWGLQAGALSLAPLTVVQPTLAAGLFVLLIAGVRLTDERVGRREVVAVVAICMGVTGLAFASPKEVEVGHAPALALGLALAVLAAAALSPYMLRGRPPAWLVVVSAGLAYACSGFLTKFVADSVSQLELLTAVLWLGATACAAAIGLLSEMTALQRRSAIRVFPGVLVLQIVLAVLLAPLLAGETWSSDPIVLGGLASSLAVLAIGAAVLASTDAIAEMVDS
jgi:drug/metabolite transporter (DMT)-like permease